MFIINGLKFDKLIKLIDLTSIFNSPLGMAYQTIANLDAIKEVQTHYNDKDTQRKIEMNLKELKIMDVNKERTKLYGLINPFAKSVYEDLKDS